MEGLDKLQALRSKLTDAVFSEADPDKWAGGTKDLESLTQRERGDRYWCKKNAAASLSVLTKVVALIQTLERGSSAPGYDPEDDFDDEIKTAEDEASKILKRIAASRDRA
jgi:hypothetical protein